jgi:hypothetical protein
MTTAAGTDYPADDAFETDVLPVRRRPRLPIVTALLVLAAIAAAAFVGGVEIQKHYGASSASTSAASGAAGATRGGGFAGFAGRGATRGRAFGGFGGGGAGAAGGTTTAGLVTLIKGSTLYVTDFTGNTIKVSTPKGLRVSKTVTSSVKNIHPGDSVVVVATKTKGGYVARSVTVNSG